MAAPSTEVKLCFSLVIFLIFHHISCDNLYQTYNFHNYLDKKLSLEQKPAEITKDSVFKRTFLRRQEVGRKNLHWFNKNKLRLKQHSSFKNGKGAMSGSPVVGFGEFVPGQKVNPFQLPTLKGVLKYPGPVINETTPVLINSYKPYSGFLDCLWTSNQSVTDLLLHSPNNTHYIFTSDTNFPFYDVNQLHDKFQNIGKELMIKYPSESGRIQMIQAHLHFVTIATHNSATWIPAVLKQWACQDHNCGYDQAVITSPQIIAKHGAPLIQKRLDARYDWLPSPTSTFGNETIPLEYAGDGCSGNSSFKGKIVMVSDGNCSYFQKVFTLEKLGAVGVIVLCNLTSNLKDMTCNGTECTKPLSIPATMIYMDDAILQ